MLTKITLFGISYDDNFQLWIKICLVRNSLQIYFYAIKFFQRIRDFFLGKHIMNFHLWFEKESIWNCMFSFTLHIIFMRLKIWRSWSMVSKTCTIKVTPMLSAVYYHRWVVPLGDSNIKYPIRTQYEVFTNNFWRGKGKNSAPRMSCFKTSWIDETIIQIWTNFHFDVALLWETHPVSFCLLQIYVIGLYTRWSKPLMKNISFR